MAEIHEYAERRRQPGRQRRPAAVNVLRMPKHARMPHHVGKMPVADAFEHRRGFGIGKAVQQVEFALARSEQTLLQDQRRTERAVLGRHCKVDHDPSARFVPVEQHPTASGGAHADR